MLFSHCLTYFTWCVCDWKTTQLLWHMGFSTSKLPHSPLLLWHMGFPKSKLSHSQRWRDRTSYNVIKLYRNLNSFIINCPSWTNLMKFSEGIEINIWSVIHLKRQQLTDWKCAGIKLYSLEVCRHKIVFSYQNSWYGFRLFEKIQRHTTLPAKA